jgi:uncharacterized membrane protein YbjE (DUF340 family)
MQQITGTLVSLATYLALVAAGAFLGSRPVLRSRTLPWLGRFQTAALLLLIFTLGAELGANEEIVASLGVIGLNAFLITAAAMAGSLLAVHILRKYILKLDKHGQPAGSAQTQEKHGEKVKVDHTLTLLIVFTVALGMVLGHFVLPDALAVHCGQIIQLGLYLLLFLVGLDLGRQEGMLSSVRQAGLRVVLVPLAVMVGTFTVTVFAGLLLPLGPKDCVAAAAGFGWYSLAPTLLAPYSLTVSATAFLSNVLHELFAIVLAPIVAQRFGYIETVALPGAAAMDTVLPVVVSATDQRMAIYSFTSGVILSLSVPLFIPAITALPF